MRDALLLAIGKLHSPLTCDWLRLCPGPVCHWPAACCLKGMLHHFDLPDIQDALRAAGVAVELSEPWDAQMLPAELGASQAASTPPTAKL